MSGEASVGVCSGHGLSSQLIVCLRLRDLPAPLEAEGTHSDQVQEAKQQPSFTAGLKWSEEGSALLPTEDTQSHQNYTAYRVVVVVVVLSFI